MGDKGRRWDSPSITRNPSPNTPIALDLLGGDAWAWQKTLTGTCPDCPPEATIALRVNGTPVPTERDGDVFSAVAQFDPGANEVVAVATMPDGREERSTLVTYTVRLEPRPTARLTTRVDGERVIFDGTASEVSEYDGAAIKTWSVTPRLGGKMIGWQGGGENVPATPRPRDPAKFNASSRTRAR